MADQNNSLAVRGGALAKQLSKSLQVGSLDDLVRVQKEANIWLLIDCSGSMSTHMRNNKTRITGLREAVQSIQTEKRMPMIQFGQAPTPSVVEYVPDPQGGTPLHLAIDLARTNESSRAIVISDGEPDSDQLALEAAARFGGRIDVVFVGDPGTRGESFLKRLAESTGGESFTGDLQEPKKLAAGVMGLLTAAADADDDDDA